MMTLFRWLWRIFFKKKDVPVIPIEYAIPTFRRVRMTKVLSITPGRNHAWVESSAGKIRKPVEAIPDHLLKAYVS